MFHQKTREVRMNHPLSGNFLLSSLLFFIIALSSLLLVNSSGSSSSSSSEEDKLTRGMSIRRNQTLISESGRFALGFFNPGNSSNLYLGIWYNMIPEQTVVWVANRDSPIINNSNGVLMISDDGNLVVLEDTKPVWSSKISFLDVPMSSNSLVAVLENSGNFVLRDNTGIVLWQSFNNPTDTLLPGMEISMKVDDHDKRLTSWKDKDDPATGQFVIGLDPRGINQYFIWNKSRPYWRSDVWDGSLIHSSFQMPSKVALSFYYAAYHALDSSSILRFKLDRTGSVKVLSWKEENKKWVTSWQFPQDRCDFYNPCGSFGSCDINNSSHPCSCLQGFKPKVQEDWDLGDWSGGCVREKQLKCDEGDVFVRLEWKVKMPDDSFLLSNLSLKQCESECRRHCSCIAYAYCNDDPNVEWTPRCFHWVGNLRDVGRRYDYGGHDLYLRVRISELGESVKIHKTRRSIVIVGMVTSAIGVLLIVLFCGIMLKRKLKEQRWRTSSVTDINFKASNSFGSWNGSELISFSLSSILAATHNFSETTKLGEGGFGPVYKGSLPKGQEIAIKRLSKSSGQGQEEFMNEVTLIAKLQHKNLVRLIGCCIEKEEKMLIYEYLPNKSLDKFLFDPHKQVNLDWSVRFHIIEGIAQGLLYLHKYSRVRIIHRDLKASNVLLDSAMNPKISDFGMARIFGGNQTEANTARVVGTYGYMSPEYALNGHFSEKSDVFSFGVLLIEIVSSKRNTGFYSTDHAPTLLGYAWELWRQERALELLDQSIKDSCNDHEVLRCIQIGLLCVQEDPGARPTMSSVAFMLGNNSTNLSLPKQPATFVGRSSNNVNAGLSSKICSINEVTISSIESR